MRSPTGWSSRKFAQALGGRLRLALTGAAPLDIKILEFFNACGTTLLEGWGLTETAAGFTVNSLDHYRMGTVGRVYPGSELQDRRGWRDSGAWP